MPTVSKVQPKYIAPNVNRDGTQRIPRLVNERWLLMALRANARASRAGKALPWHDVDLYTRTAGLIEMLVVRGVL